MTRSARRTSRPDRQLHADAVVKSSKQDIDRPWRTAEYVEAQIHGGMTADDIARVVFPIGTPDLAYPAPRKIPRPSRRARHPGGWHRRPPIPNAEIPGQGKLDGMSLAADAGGRVPRRSGGDHHVHRRRRRGPPARLHHP